MIVFTNLAFFSALVLRGYAERIDTSGVASTYESVTGCDAYCFRFSADGSILNLPLGTPLSTCRQLMRSELESGNRYGAVDKINSYCGGSCNCKNEDANFEAQNGGLTAKASLVEEKEKQHPNENHPEATAEATNIQATNVGSAVPGNMDGGPTANVGVEATPLAGPLDEDGIVGPSSGVNGYNGVSDGQVPSSASDAGHVEVSDMSKKQQAPGGDASYEQRSRRGRKTRFFQRTKRGKRGARTGRQKRRKNRRSNSSRGRRHIDQEQGQGQGQGPQGHQVHQGHQEQGQGQGQGHYRENQGNQAHQGQGQGQNRGSQGPEGASIKHHSRSVAKQGNAGGSAGGVIHAIYSASNDINDSGTNPTSNTGGSTSNDRDTSTVSNSGGSVSNVRGSTPAGNSGGSVSHDPESSPGSISRGSSSNDRGSRPASNSGGSARSNRGSSPASNSGGSASNDRGSSPASKSGSITSNNRGSSPASSSISSSSNDIVDTPEKDADTRGRQGVPAVVAPLPSNKESVDGSPAYVPRAHRTKDPKSEGNPVQRMRMPQETRLEAARGLNLSTSSTTLASIGASTRVATTTICNHEANASNASKTPLSVSAALRTTKRTSSATQPASKIAVLVEAIRKALSIYDGEAEVAKGSEETHIEENESLDVDSTAKNQVKLVNEPNKQSDSSSASSEMEAPQRNSTNQTVGTAHTVESLANKIRSVLDGTIGGTRGKQTQT
eukprot:TRINITY_DN8265_c0_g1_i2.p1 TRINITY_DN8265_c0_g1~~TRINITY_DN8265_c0_g1_i2.p1  ORF type:complete len:736 (-),score=111.28 TRINITY_DN8265_c0_g1_i2:131-2302(-)